MLSRLFRRLFVEGLMALHRIGQLKFFGDLIDSTNANTFAKWLAPLREVDWGVYAKPPFGGPEAVLAYLSRYTHRVAISNHRLVSADAGTVTFKWKDYRIKRGDRMKAMRLPTFEFIRRFLMHVLPDRFHRIHNYGFLAGACSKEKSPGSACYLETSNRRNQPNHRMKRHHLSHCVNHAPSVADRCASPRPSGVGKSPEPAPRQESRPHDEPPISCASSGPTRNVPVKGKLWLHAINAS